MTARTLGATSFRIVSIYLFVQVLAYLPSVVALLGRIDDLDVLGNTVYFVIITVAPPAVMLVCGVLLFFLSERLSKKLFVPDVAVELIDRKDVEAIAFAVAGVWVFGCSIPGLMGTASHMVSEFNKIGDGAGHTDIPWQSAIAYAAQAFVGLLLFFQAGPIARWWSRRVIAGRKQEVSHDA